MVKNNRSKKRKLSTSEMRKARNSVIWRERTMSRRIIDSNVTLFISQENIKIVKLDESEKADTPFSTIVSSKGKIVID